MTTFYKLLWDNVLNDVHTYAARWITLWIFWEMCRTAISYERTHQWPGRILSNNTHTNNTLYDKAMNNKLLKHISTLTFNWSLSLGTCFKKKKPLFVSVQYVEHQKHTWFSLLYVECTSEDY